MEAAAGDQIVDPGAWLEAGVELQQRIRPQQAVAQFVVDHLPDARITDRDEAPDVGAIVIDQPVAQRKCVHGVLLPVGLSCRRGSQSASTGIAVQRKVEAVQAAQQAAPLLRLLYRTKVNPQMT